MAQTPLIHIPAFAIVIKCCNGVSLARCRTTLNLSHLLGQFKVNGIAISPAVEEDIVLSSRNFYEFAVTSKDITPDVLASLRNPHGLCHATSHVPSHNSLVGFHQEVAATLEEGSRRNETFETSRGLALAGGETAMATAEDFTDISPAWLNQTLQSTR
eukprot:m.72898 g.72898  ORF g.72898 m.72898 type:complete len:158 (-) comp14291_c0_seq1:159-632(-)